MSGGGGLEFLPVQFYLFHKGDGKLMEGSTRGQGGVYLRPGGGGLPEARGGVYPRPGGGLPEAREGST